ncbi:MAG: polysaccharide deacetylase family protein [Anaerolineae bacterium]|nr:polysaccharide deacetylase family protein [Anaerolineae bacterium]
MSHSRGTWWRRGRPWLFALLTIVAVLSAPLPVAGAAVYGRPAVAPVSRAPALEVSGYSGVVRAPVSGRCMLASRATSRRGAGVALCPGEGQRRQLHLPVIFRAGRSPLPQLLAIGPTTVPPTVAVGPTPDGVVRTVDLPILMYHHVGDVPAGADSIRRGLTVSESNFRAQMAYLRDSGYEPVTLAALVQHLAVGAPLPERPVIITLDDGYRDAYDVAFPVLKEYGFVATLFLVTAPIDEGSHEFVTWDQVREMHSAGIEMGAHSYTHPDLRGQSTDYLVWQIVGSKEAIEERIEEPVRFLAYPSGAYDENVVRVVRSAGFWGAVTIESGCRHSEATLWTLSRIRVQPQDGVKGLASKLEACLDR